MGSDQGYLRRRYARYRGMRNHSLKYLFWAVAFFCFLSPVLVAQTTSTVEGTVKDKQGLTVAGAQIRVTSSELAIDRTVTTESDGGYRVTALPPGNYEVKASKDGFESAVFKNLEVTLNRTLTLDVTLLVGSMSQTVEVDSAVPLLEMAASSTGSTITPQQIEDMPINGRRRLNSIRTQFWNFRW